eukprot:Amastigsp_a679060_38.p2 type:complete len:210 gc:universal Amastigsp_a679060_38:1221-592(-)
MFGLLFSAPSPGQRSADVRRRRGGLDLCGEHSLKVLPELVAKRLLLEILERVARESLKRGRPPRSEALHASRAEKEHRGKGRRQRLRELGHGHHAPKDVARESEHALVKRVEHLGANDGPGHGVVVVHDERRPPVNKIHHGHGREAPVKNGAHVALHQHKVLALVRRAAHGNQSADRGHELWRFVELGCDPIAYANEALKLAFENPSAV